MMYADATERFKTLKNDMCPIEPTIEPTHNYAESQYNDSVMD